MNGPTNSCNIFMSISSAISSTVHRSIWPFQRSINRLNLHTWTGTYEPVQAVTFSLTPPFPFLLERKRAMSVNSNAVIDKGQIRLTQFSHGAGCGCKIRYDDHYRSTSHSISACSHPRLPVTHPLSPSTTKRLKTKEFILCTIVVLMKLLVFVYNVLFAQSQIVR